MNTKKVLYLVGSFAAGVAVGFLVSKNQLEAKYDARANEEVAEVKEHYKILHKSEYPEPKDYIADKYRDKLIDLGYETEEERMEVAAGLDRLMAGGVDAGTHISNAFDLSEDQDDSTEIKIPPLMEPMGDPMQDPEWVESVKNRDTDEPYVISVDEFTLERNEYDKVTLGYYREDDTLVDENDIPVDDIEQVIGAASLGQFGKFSGDKNIVYVRNERVGIDYEVMFDERSYQEVILGIRESNVQPKFREDD